jgi:hypothetical protein
MPESTGVSVSVTETITTVDTPVVAATPPLLALGGPVAYFSAGTLGFGGQSGTVPLTVSNLGQLNLSLASVTPSGSSLFTISQIACTSGASALPATLPSGGACVFSISYAAPASGTPTGALKFTDNAPLSNLASAASGGNFTQSIHLSGAGTTTAPPPPPSAGVSVSVKETIKTVDAENILIPATNPACAVNNSGINIATVTVNVTDVQTILNEALGIIPATHDLTRDGIVNIVDVQLVSNAVLGLGCWGSE